MNINTNKGLTIVLGKNASSTMYMIYQKLLSDKNYQVHGHERYATNIRNNVYNTIRNELQYIVNNLKYSTNKNPVIVFLPEFDFVQNITEIEKIKAMIKDFINNAVISIHIYVASSTYEMCRNEEVLLIDTNKIIRFSDYEEYRNIKISLEE